MTPQDSSQAAASSIVSITSFAVAKKLSILQVQPIITMIAGLIAIVSGIMAIRYYYFTTKKIIKDDEVPK